MQFGSNKNEKVRTIARLDIKGQNLIKSINLEGLKKWVIRVNLQKNTTMKKLMS